MYVARVVAEQSATLVSFSPYGIQAVSGFYYQHGHNGGPNQHF
jgi:hypothetical protein